MQQLQSIIDAAFERRAEISPTQADPEIREAVSTIIDALDQGSLRVAEKIGHWVTHQWLKKAVLLSFRLHPNVAISAGCMQYFDKIETKFSRYSEADFIAEGFRVAPPP